MTILFYKKQIYPIIIPIKMYIDKHNEYNSFHDMNPSMHVDPDGNVKILVRSINYRKFYSKQFTMYENHSKSYYVLLFGKIHNNDPLNLDNFEAQNITYDYAIPTYPTYWMGMEDIRFIDEKSLLAIIPECNEGGNPSIFRATIEGNNIHSFTNCKPNIVEKNWMPFKDENGNENVIYSLHPFKIKQIETEDFKEIIFSEEIMSQLENYHGSTNGIQYKSNKNILFLIHKNDDKTYHRWILFNYKTNELKVSNEFYFFKYSYIEFPVSLSIFNERIFISLGINDDKAFIIETNYESIEKCFV